MIRINGNATIREAPLRSVLRRTGGNSYERRWWGLAASVSAFVPPNNPDEVSFDQQIGSAIATKTAQYTGKPTGEEVAVETMTIRFNDVTFPIAQNPSFINITPDRLKILNENGQPVELDGTENETEIAYYYTELEYYYCKQMGHDSFRAKLAVVNYSRTVSANYNTSLDLAGVGAIYSTLEASEEMGAPVLFDIPASNVGIIADTAAAYELGWLKDAELDYTGDGKLIMRVTFEYGLWRKSLNPTWAAV